MAINSTTFRLPKEFLHPEVAGRMLHPTQVGKAPWKQRLFPGPVPAIKYYTGGKRGMIPQLQALLPGSMEGLGSGFLGTGAVELHLYGRGLLQGKPIILVEANPHVALIWEQLQTVEPQDIINAYYREVEKCELALGKTKHLGQWRVTRQEYAYHKRLLNGWLAPGLFEERPDMLARFHTSLFILNTCVGGVFRFNLSGGFNVEFNKKRTERTEVFVPSEIPALHRALQNMTFIRGDYAALCKRPLPTGSFIFLDPPYYQTFDSYTRQRFDASEFSRFVEAVKILNSRGYQILITQSFHPKVKEALGPINGFNLAMVFRRDSFGAGIIPEYVFRNYLNNSPDEQVFMAEVQRVEAKYVELVRAVQMGQDPVLIAVELARLNVIPSDTLAAFSRG